MDENEGHWCAPESSSYKHERRGGYFDDANADAYEEMEQDEDKNDDILLEETTIHEKLIEFKKDEHKPMPPQLAKKAPVANAAVAPCLDVPPLVVTIPTYKATEDEQKEWITVKELWQQAGEESQSQILSHLPSPQHTAFVNFFVGTAPYTPHTDMTKACQSLLTECPSLASALRQHRLALDPLANLSNETFLAPSGAGVMTTGHNDRVLRDVLGFGINHLTESVSSQAAQDKRPAVMALKACLAAWRNHAGRLLL